MASGTRNEHFGPPDVLQLVHTNIPDQDVTIRLDHTIPASLKRRASSTFEDTQERSSRKKAREEEGTYTNQHNTPEEGHIDGHALADELELELQCGCCSALVYRPVIVSPCQHFFCGSCIVLWIRPQSGGTNCPACRGISTSVSPSRALQTMTDVLVRSAPFKARTVSERMQADEIYSSGLTLRIPSPRQASPEPTIPPSNGSHIRPCPHCVPDNQWGWRCTQPIPDPDADPDGAWHTDNGTPPGHGFCGNCESILSLHAPTTSKCDFCQVSFCGISIPGRCLAAPLVAQQPHGFSDLGDLIQCGEVYECFDHNTVEVDIMLDYITAQGLSPRHIYREIIAIILRSPRQFSPLIEQELFVDLHVVAGGIDPDPSAPRHKICRMCASEVLLWGLRDWWVQERKKGFLEPDVMSRPDCPEGSLCTRQKDHAHAKAFNHIVSNTELSSLPQPGAPQQSVLPSLAVDPPARESVPEPQSHAGQQPERNNGLPIERTDTLHHQQVIETVTESQVPNLATQPMIITADASMLSSQDQVDALL